MHSYFLFGAISQSYSISIWTHLGPITMSWYCNAPAIVVTSILHLFLIIPVGYIPRCYSITIQTSLGLYDITNLNFSILLRKESVPNASFSEHFLHIFLKAEIQVNKTSLFFQLIMPQSSKCKTPLLFPEQK